MENITHVWEEKEASGTAVDIRYSLVLIISLPFVVLFPTQEPACSNLNNYELRRSYGVISK